MIFVKIIANALKNNFTLIYYKNTELTYINISGLLQGAFHLCITGRSMTGNKFSRITKYVTKDRVHFIKYFSNFDFFIVVQPL